MGEEVLCNPVRYSSYGNRGHIIGMLCHLYWTAHHDSVGMYADHRAWLAYAREHTIFYWGWPNDHPVDAWFNRIVKELS